MRIVKSFSDMYYCSKEFRSSMLFRFCVDIICSTESCWNCTGTTLCHCAGPFCTHIYCTPVRPVRGISPLCLFLKFHPYLNCKSVDKGASRVSWHDRAAAQVKLRAHVLHHDLFTIRVGRVLS